MTPQQLAVLNSLVTYAAENIPGGLSDDEIEVARIVGGWAIGDAPLNQPIVLEDSSVERFRKLSPPEA